MAMSTMVSKLRRLSPWLKALCLLCAVAALSHTFRQLELRPEGKDGSDGGKASWFDAYRRLKKKRPHMLAKERQKEEQQEEEQSTAPTPSPTTGLNGRIVGGHEAQRGRYKALAALYSDDNHMCGGALIGSNVLITAAHCLPVINKVRTNIFDKRTKGGEIESFDITKKIACPKYGNGPLGNQCDIAVLELSGHSKMPPVRLNDDAAVPRNDQGVTVVGWGALAEGGFTSSKQQEVEVFAMPNTECETFYPGRITDDMMCAAVEGGGKDACQGDSGGPCFVTGGSAAEDVLIGVVSWGRGCARADSPGVYGRVSSELEWIKRSCCSINAQAECCVGGGGGTPPVAADEPISPQGAPGFGGPRPPLPGSDSYVLPQRPPTQPSGGTNFNPPRPQPQVQKVTLRPTLRPTPPPTRHPTMRPIPPSPQQDNALSSQWGQQGSQQQQQKPPPPPPPPPPPQQQQQQQQTVTIPGLNYDEQTQKELGYDPVTGLYHVHNKQP